MAGETIVRSRNRSLKDIYIAPVTTNNGTTYATGTPMKLVRAINAKIKDKFDLAKVWSDDSVEDMVESYEGTDIDFEVNSLAPQDYAALYENLYKNGYLLKASGDKAKEIAIGWRSKKLNGKYEFEWYYCGKLERPERDLETDTDKTKTQTAKLKGQFYARQKEDTIEGIRKNLYSISVDESNLLTDNTNAAAAILNWFSSVQEYNISIIEVTYTGYTTGTVTDISIAGATFITSTKKFTGIPSTATSFTFKLDGTLKTATLSGATWNFV